MNEINLKLTVEQLALMQNLLSPYVELYQSITQQYTIANKKQIIQNAVKEKEQPAK